jgi:hypothetical protein
LLVRPPLRLSAGSFVPGFNGFVGLRARQARLLLVFVLVGAAMAAPACHARFARSKDMRHSLGVRNLAAFASCLSGFLGSEFVGCPLLVSRLAAFAGDFSLFGSIHCGESPLACAGHFRIPFLHANFAVKLPVWGATGMPVVPGPSSAPAIRNPNVTNGGTEIAPV